MNIADPTLEHIGGETRDAKAVATIATYVSDAHVHHYVERTGGGNISSWGFSPRGNAALIKL